MPFLLDAKTLAMGDCFTFSTDYGPLDVLAIPRGTRGFEELVRNAQPRDLFGHHVQVASIDDLIRMKRAAGRTKDHLALTVLQALRDELDR